MNRTPDECERIESENKALRALIGELELRIAALHRAIAEAESAPPPLQGLRACVLRLLREGPSALARKVLKLKL